MALSRISKKCIMQLFKGGGQTSMDVYGLSSQDFNANVKLIGALRDNANLFIQEGWRE